MNPVVGLDVSKGQSEGQVFLNKGQPYGRSFRFLHTLEGFKDLLSIINEVRSKTGSSPVVILESTGHYHQAVVQFLKSQEILFLVINPQTKTLFIEFIYRQTIQHMIDDNRQPLNEFTPLYAFKDEKLFMFYIEAA